jgi:hypothetical protein
MSGSNSNRREARGDLGAIVDDIVGHFHERVFQGRSLG